MWTKYFSKIYLINLLEREDRLTTSNTELSKYNISYKLFPAIKMDNGVDGIKATLKAIFEEAIKNDYANILIFEDDIKFVENPNKYMAQCISQVPDYWEILYLGVNTHAPFTMFLTPNILQVNEGYGLHAVAYSKEAIKLIYELCFVSKPIAIKDQPIDVIIADSIQPRGNCYCTYPLLATQHSGYSDIEKKEMKQDYIVDRFMKNIGHLLK